MRECEGEGEAQWERETGGQEEEEGAAEGVGLTRLH
jgi:hypothetical protein